MPYWSEKHCWKSVPVIVAAFFGIQYFLSRLEAQPPLDRGFAYVAMRDYLQSSNVIDRNADLNFVSSNMVEHNGEAIMSGTGSARSVDTTRFELPVFEQVEMEFVAIITRHCFDQTASCYLVEEMNLTREENIWPLI